MYNSESFSSFILSLLRIGFPWVKSRFKPEDIADNFLKYQPVIKNEKYKLSAYYSKGKDNIQLEFRGNPIIVTSTEETLFTIDILSDIWIEDHRVKAKKNFTEKSPKESYNLAPIKLETFFTLKKEHPNRDWDANAVRSTFAFITKEVRPFRLTWIKGILQAVYGNLDILKGKRWLDISAGWGDRLLAAGLLGMEYLGFDPNTELMEGHNQMMKFLNKDTKGNLRVEYLPFEESSLVLEKEKPFDLILSSPPFFDLEIYSSAETQSVNKFPRFNDWMNNFLFKSLEIAWEHLLNEGYLILYVGDLKNMQICDPMNSFIKTLKRSSYEGVLGIGNDIGTFRPCWVWKKNM